MYMARMDRNGGVRLVFGFALLSTLSCGGSSGTAKEPSSSQPEVTPGLATDAAVPQVEATAQSEPDAATPQAEAASHSEPDARVPEEPAWNECDGPIETTNVQSRDLGTVTVTTCPDELSRWLLLRSAKHGAVGLETMASHDSVRDWFSPDGNRLFVVQPPSPGCTLTIFRLASLFEAPGAASKSEERLLDYDKMESLAELSFIPVASLRPTFREHLKRRKWNWRGWHGIINPPDEDTEYPLGSSSVFGVKWRSNNLLKGLVHFGSEGEGTPFCVKVKQRLFKENDEKCRSGRR